VWGGSRLEVCGCGQNFSNSCKFGADADTKFQPCLFSQVFSDPTCFFQFPFLLDSKALAIHQPFEALVISVLHVMSAFLLARNFGRGTQELPFNGSYPIVWISNAKLSEMSTHSHSSEILRGPRVLVLLRDSTIRSCLLIQEQFNFLIWIDVLPRGFASLEICFFHLWSQNYFHFGLRLDFCDRLSFHSSQKWFWIKCHIAAWFKCELICETLEGRLFFLHQFQHLIINFVDELSFFELWNIFDSKFLCFHQ